MEFKEDKQAICDAMLAAIRLTNAGGSHNNNPLAELRFMPSGGRFDETVRPIFADGAGGNGYYDINVTYDSGIVIIQDIVRQFVNHIW